MNRPIHFEYHSSDPAATQGFLEKIFGWKFQKWDGPEEYWLVTTGEGEGINGGLMKSRDAQPRTVNTIQVADVEATARLVEQHGGQVVVPKMAIPGVGWLVYFVEPAGNIIGIMQHDADAR